MARTHTQEFKKLCDMLETYPLPHNDQLLHTLTLFLKGLHLHEARITHRPHTEALRFYQLVDRYLVSLEHRYRAHGLRTAEEKTHHAKMHFRTRAAWQAGFWGRFFGYSLLGIISDYGTSFTRWLVTLFVLIFSFASLYYLIGLIAGAPPIQDMSGPVTPIDYLYFSFTTFTTLGFGDVLPALAATKLLSGLEAICGYLMLGFAIALIERKL